MASYILSHDLGTTGDKATLFSAEGKLISSTFASYQTYYPEIGWAEQDPDHYWRAFCESTKALIDKAKIKPFDIAVVSFSGQMMAALPVDKDGKALRNSIIWADLRSTKQVGELSTRIGEDSVYEITGHRLSASYSATKIMWIRENEPEVYKNTHKFIHAKDFIVSRLTGNIYSDYSDASGMNLLDIKSLDWSEELLEATKIDQNKLPDLVESTEVVGKVTGKASSLSGLIQGTPVVIGGGDGACATCGAGVMGERSPLWNPKARGCFIGLSIVHTKSQMIRSVLEGVAYNMKIIEEAFAEQGVRHQSIRIIGGGAKSKIWRRIFADVMEKPISRLNFIEEATSVGAAIAGGVGAGFFSSIHDAKGFVKIEEEINPDERNYPVYRRYYTIFKKSYEQLMDVFDMLLEK